MLLLGFTLIEEEKEVWTFVFVSSNSMRVEKFFFLLERFCNVIFCVNFTLPLLGLIRPKLTLLGFTNASVWAAFGMLIKPDPCAMTGYVFSLTSFNVFAVLARAAFNCSVVQSGCI